MLPVKVDMSWVPQFPQDNEIPPPVPPKISDTIDVTGAGASEPNGQHHLQIKHKSDSAPALPPKPINNRLALSLIIILFIDKINYKT